MDIQTTEYNEILRQAVAVIGNADYLLLLPQKELKQLVADEIKAFNEDVNLKKGNEI